MATRIGINGFGRIGRQVLRATMERHPDKLTVAAVNDLTDAKTNAHLFKYDSTYGRYPGSVTSGDSSITVDGHEIAIQAKTGLILDAYFSGTKIAWLLDHVDGARDRAERGELAFGTIDSWLAWKLTDGRFHITDVTNASRTLLMDLTTLDWDPNLLDAMDIPAAMLPQIVPSIGRLGVGVGPLAGVLSARGAVAARKASKLLSFRVSAATSSANNARDLAITGASRSHSKMLWSPTLKHDIILLPSRPMALSPNNSP